MEGNFIYMDEISNNRNRKCVDGICVWHPVQRRYNAACEPYLQQLSKMLVRDGRKDYRYWV